MGNRDSVKPSGITNNPTISTSPGPSYEGSHERIAQTHSSYPYLKARLIPIDVMLPTENSYPYESEREIRKRKISN